MDNTNNKVIGIVLAAGQGKRMNTTISKQFLVLRDKPLLYYSLKAFNESSVEEIILVVRDDMIDYCKEYIVDAYNLNKVIKIVAGGKERYDSVYQALSSIDNADYVLIHDGARPLITKEQIEEIIIQARLHKACILATPVKDSIKVIDNDGYIACAPIRNTLWAAQTPQAFEFQGIKRAYSKFYDDHNRDDQKITDDAMVYETYLNKKVKIIEGSYENIKVTTVEDLPIADLFLNNRV